MKWHRGMKTSFSVQTARPTVDIVVVTYNNFNMLDRCLSSIKANTCEPVRIIIVNNGDKKFDIPPIINDIEVINPGKNLGWTHGVNEGVKFALAHDPAPFIMWMNDDTQILPHDYGWLTKMLNCFQLDSRIAVVAPSSNNVMGLQSTNHVLLPPAVETNFISGMCVLTRKEIVEEIGQLDQNTDKACGDDLDFSIRVTDKGYKICICTRAFVLHFCSATGKRLFGDFWNSPEQGEEINTWLIKKHGFKKWFNCVQNIPSENKGFNFIDAEEKFALEELMPYIDEGKMVIDVGCGGKKIHPKVIGIDIRGSDELGVGANSRMGSSGEIKSDILNLPFEQGEVNCILAKHLFEHILDPLKALKEWRRVLVEDGKLVIICPDYRYCEAISCDPSHVHAYTPETVRSLLEVCGFEVTRDAQVLPGYVFMVSAKPIKVRELCTSA